MLADWVALVGEESLADMFGEDLEKGGVVVDSPDVSRDSHPYTEGTTLLSCGGVLLSGREIISLIDCLSFIIELILRLHWDGKGGGCQGVVCGKFYWECLSKIDSLRCVSREVLSAMLLLLPGVYQVEDCTWK